MTQRHILYPMCYQPYIDMVLDRALKAIQEGRVPEFAQDATPPEIQATLTIESPSALRKVS